MKHDDTVVKNQSNIDRHFYLLALVAAAMLAVSGCMMVGPNYVRPPVPTEDQWMDTDARLVKREPPVTSAWWTVFNDPVLTTLVETAYRQNPSLRAAGVRVLEAQARRGIAIGELFPQQQEAFGAGTSNQVSENRANRAAAPT